MNRREALRAGTGLAALVALSGCSGGGAPADERGAAGTPGEGGEADATTSEPPGSTESTATGTVPATAPAVDHAARFRSFLDAEGVAVRDLRESGPVVALGYVTGSTDHRAVSREIGRVSGGFFRGVRDGWDATRLEATVLDATGTPLATWYARAEWFREFERGGTTADELSLAVLRTVERTDGNGTGTPTGIGAATADALQRE